MPEAQLRPLFTDRGMKPRRYASCGGYPATSNGGPAGRPDSSTVPSNVRFACFRPNRTSGSDVASLASRGSTYKSGALPPPRRPRRRWARYLSAANSPTSRRTWRTVQPHEAARSSWVTERQLPVSSTARAMASRSCFLRPVAIADLPTLSPSTSSGTLSRCTNRQGTAGFLG